MTGDEGNMARPLGSVLDSEGNRVDVLAAPDGTVVIEHVMGSVEIEPEWMTAFRELIDRAAMPGQPAEKAPAPVHLPSGGERVESAVHRLLGLPEGS